MSTGKAIFLLPIVFIIYFPSVTMAASFDCSKARSPLEIIICADPSLSSLDGQVGEAYVKARSGFPADSQESISILHEQRTFLKERTIACPIPLVPQLSTNDSSGIIACLKNEYTIRLNNLNRQIAAHEPKPLPVVANNVPTPVIANNIKNNIPAPQPANVNNNAETANAPAAQPIVADNHQAAIVPQKDEKKDIANTAIEHKPDTAAKVPSVTIVAPVIQADDNPSAIDKLIDRVKENFVSILIAILALIVVVYVLCYAFTEIQYLILKAIKLTKKIQGQQRTMEQPKQENMPAKPLKEKPVNKPIIDSFNININPPNTVTQGENMFFTYMKGFIGGTMQLVGGIASFILFLACFSEDSTDLTKLLFLVALAATIYGGFLRYQSKQTVQIGGEQSTKPK